MVGFQQRLQVLLMPGTGAAYYQGDADGTTRISSLEAVKRFQSDRGLTADGIAGPRTQASLEEAARGALLKAGFTESADAKAADVVVSLGARVSRSGPAPWDDPLWWRWNGSYWGWRYGPAWRPYYSRWGYSYPMDPMMERRYDREVAMLLRDRKTNEPLYEARASNDGLTEGGKELFGALFEASLADFPQTRPEPHRVSVPLTPSR